MSCSQAANRKSTENGNAEIRRFFMSAPGFLFLLWGRTERSIAKFTFPNCVGPASAVLKSVSLVHGMESLVKKKIATIACILMSTALTADDGLDFHDDY